LEIFEVCENRAQVGTLAILYNVRFKNMGQVWNNNCGINLSRMDEVYVRKTNIYVGKDVNYGKIKGNIRI
jgi:hypothetical protein